MRHGIATKMCPDSEMLGTVLRAVLSDEGAVAGEALPDVECSIGVLLRELCDTRPYALCDDGSSSVR